jgi:hypothetical protein
MSKLITFNCQVETIQSRKDNTLKIILGTQELTEGGKLFPLQNKLCTIGIIANDSLTQEDIDLLQSSKLGIDDIPNSKSQSQRLRNVLFIYWKQNDGGYSDFNLFYQNRMDKIIDQIKSKLEP